MAKTPHFEWETPDLADEADIPADLIALATEIEEDLNGLDVAELGTSGAGDAGKLLIVQGTGAAAWKAMSADATIGASGAISIVNEKVTTAKIALLNITEALLAGEAVSSGKIKALAVTAAKLAAEAVETAKIANLAITEAKLAGEAVGTTKLAALAVTTAKLANLCVTSEKLGNEAVTTEKIKGLAVSAAKLAANAVETAKIKDGAVTDAKLDKPVIAGSIKEDGTTELGTGFASERFETARYRITLAEELGATGVGIATATTQNRMFRNAVKGKKVFEFHCVNAAEISQNSGFNFMIKEP